MKSLAEAYADRLHALSKNVSWHTDAFDAHLGVLVQARIDEGHVSLIKAVKKAAFELGAVKKRETVRAIEHIAQEKMRCDKIARSLRA